MIKKALAVAGATAILLGTGVGVASAEDGNAWGKKAGDCVAALDLNLGKAIQAGRAAHEGAKITPQSIVESVHCA